METRLSQEPKKPAFSMRTPVDMTEASAALLVMANSLRITLIQMAEEHEFQSGPWFDDLADRLVREAKGTVAEGISIEQDAASVGFSVELLEGLLGVIRNKLVSKDA
jgi:hypothetical protein